MTIFARRRLQTMIDDLATVLGSSKALDIVRRLNDEKRVDQALPAEMELALLWAINSLGDLEVEPDWWGDGSRPDAITNALVPGRVSAIEIAATNDNAISGEGAMDAIALQISALASSTLKGVGSYLYFRFREESGYADGKYRRRPLAPSGYQLDSAKGAEVQSWIRSGAYLEARLRLQAPGLDVEVEHTDHKQTRYHNLYCSMPPETHSLEDNPLYDLLKRKSRQLKGAADGVLRLVFLADVGSTLLKNLGQIGEFDHTNRYVSAKEIISHFLRKNPSALDAVVTFSPYKDWGLSGRDPLGRKPRRWTVAFFGTPNFPDAPLALENVAAILPEPRYEGYQARSLFRQGAFSPFHTGQYLGMTIKVTVGQNKHSIEFPARMLLDLLAGRLTEERFRAQIRGPNGTSNIFKTWLDMGMTMSGAEMAPRDVDEDDDHIVLHFSDDPAARPFVSPTSISAEDETD